MTRHGRKLAGKTQREVQPVSYTPESKGRPTEAPAPRNKGLQATLWEKDAALRQVPRHTEERDPEHGKQWVGLVDGSAVLQRKVKEYLGRRKKYISTLL